MDDQGLKETIRSLRNRGGRLEHEGDCWTQEEKERLSEMFSEGIGISETAIRLQRTEPAVIQQIEKLDLYRRKDWPKRKKGVKKDPSCCCSSCEADPSLCPRCKECAVTEEVS